MKIPLRTVFLLGIAALLAVGVAILWLPPEAKEAGWRVVWDLWKSLERHPVLLYACMVILPAFMVPQSPFLVVAGMAYSDSFGEVGGAALAASAVALNILWSYFLTVGPLHGLVARFLGRYGRSVPGIPVEHHLKFSFLVRVTPVLPLCVQNYTLGLLKVRLGSYLLASWTTQVPLAFAIALTAGAVLEGNFGVVLLAVTILLLLVIALKWLRQRLRREPGMEGVEEKLEGRGAGKEAMAD